MKILEKARIVSGAVVTEEKRYAAYWTAVALGEKIRKTKSQAFGEEEIAARSENRETEKTISV